MIGFLLDTQFPIRENEAVDIEVGGTEQTSFEFTKENVAVLGNTEYWFAAYATNSSGRAIGQSINFKTGITAVAEIPIVETINVLTSPPQQTSAMIGGAFKATGAQQ